MSKSSPVAARVIAILEFFAVRHGEPLSYSEVARELRLSRATTHSILLSLVETGYLARDPVSMRYRLGASAIRLGSAAQHAQEQAAAYASHEMKRLADLFGLQCAAFALVDGDIVIVSTAGSPRHVEYSRRIGQRVPFRPPFGAMFLAWSDEPTKSAWLRSHGIPTMPEQPNLVDTIETIKNSGFAVWLNQDALNAYRAVLRANPSGPAPNSRELAAGLDMGSFVLRPGALAEVPADTLFEVFNIAAPVFDWRSDVAMMISLVGFRDAVTAATIREMTTEVVASAQRATATIGGVPPTAANAVRSAGPGSSPTRR